MIDDGFETLLVVDHVSKSSRKRLFEKAASSPTSPTPATQNQVGRPSLVIQIPSNVSTATAFVTANGFSDMSSEEKALGK